MSPSVYIIAGPNGAGKTTFAQTFLAKYTTCTHFINGDLIAQSLSPSHPDRAAIQAGRLMHDEILACMNRKIEFAFETTLAGRGHVRTIERLKAAGYTACIFYLWIPDIQLSLARVHGRVSGGGHNVPEPVLRRRFHRSISNFRGMFSRLVDSWRLFDNSKAEPVPIAVWEGGNIVILEAGRYKRWVGSLRQNE